MPHHDDNAQKSLIFKLYERPYEDNGGTNWVGRLGVGADSESATSSRASQYFDFLMDTGTVNTWITNVDCHSTACDHHSKFNPARSSTFRWVDREPKKNELGPWGTLSSVSGLDSFRGWEREGDTPSTLDVRFLLATYADKQGSTLWYYLDADGGIAFPVAPQSIENQQNPDTLMRVLCAMGAIDSPRVSFIYNARIPLHQCRIGGYAPCGYDPATRNTPPLDPRSTEISFWAVRADFTVGGNPVLDNVLLGLDTGSSRFKGDPRIIGPLLEAVTRGGELPTTFEDPALLGEFGSVGVSINGQSYELSPNQYIRKIASTGQYNVQFHSMEDFHEGYIWVGTTLLESMYSVFDYRFDADSGALEGHSIELYRLSP